MKRFVLDEMPDEKAADDPTVDAGPAADHIVVYPAGVCGNLMATFI